MQLALDGMHSLISPSHLLLLRLPQEVHLVPDPQRPDASPVTFSSKAAVCR